jgi:hypothetical protein
VLLSNFLDFSTVQTYDIVYPTHVEPNVRQ